TSTVDGGVVVEEAYRLSGPGFVPGGEWYRGVRAREESARGLAAHEDVWYAGYFSAQLDVGAVAEVVAWADALSDPAPRAVEVVGDTDLAAELVPALCGVVDAHLRGTRYGIAVDPADGLLTQGAPGYALTWMDARVGGTGVTARIGKAVEVNALWCNALGTLAVLLERNGGDAGRLHA